MFLNVRDMELRPIRISREYAIGEIDFAGDDFRQTSPLRVEAQAEFRPALEEIRVRGSLKVDLELVCDRCLAAYGWPVALEFDLLYEPEGTEGQPEETGLKDEEATVAFYSGNGLELEDLLREQVLLALPVKRTCQADCQGLCPVCGENRNNRQCGCEAQLSDPRWSALKELKLKN